MSHLVAGIKIIIEGIEGRRVLIVSRMTLAKCRSVYYMCMYACNDGVYYMCMYACNDGVKVSDSLSCVEDIKYIYIHERSKKF